MALKKLLDIWYEQLQINENQLLHWQVMDFHDYQKVEEYNSLSQGWAQFSEVEKLFSSLSDQQPYLWVWKTDIKNEQKINVCAQHNLWKIYFSMWPCQSETEMNTFFKKLS